MKNTAKIIFTVTILLLTGCGKEDQVVEKSTTTKEATIGNKTIKLESNSETKKAVTGKKQCRDGSKTTFSLEDSE